MVDKLLAAGGGDYTDIIDIHLYVPIPEMDRLLTKVRADMAKHGVDKPITITEVSAQLGTPLPERQKAAHVYKRYAVAEAHGVLASWWFVMHWVNTGEHRHCSLIDPGTGEPHEGAAAYSRFSAALEGADFLRRHDCGEGVWVCEWRRGDRAVWVAWGEGATGSVALPCGSGAGTVTDVAGREWPVTVSRSLTVDLRDEPLLLQLPARDAGASVPPQGAPARSQHLQLARGSSATVSLPAGDVQVHTTSGIAAARANDNLRLTADADARLGEHWLVVTAGDAGTTGFTRLRATVTETLALDLAPLPGDPPAVSWRVTNLSAEPVSATVTLVSPVSDGARKLTVGHRVSDLAAGETAIGTTPLSGAAEPLARPELTLAVETDGGVRETLTRTLVFTPAARAAATPAIDADLADWPAVETFPIVVGTDTGEASHGTDGPPSGPEDLSARAALMWDGENLYFAVRVRDDAHSSKQRDAALWDGDGLQFGFAPEPYVPSSAYYEWGVALNGAEPQAWSWRALPKAQTGDLDFPLAIRHADGEATYEMAIPWSMLAPIAPEPGMTFGLGLCVNEQDTANRGYYGWHAGIAGEKDRARFGQVTLVE